MLRDTRAGMFMDRHKIRISMYMTLNMYIPQNSDRN